jgi:hypothetical protein
MPFTLPLSDLPSLPAAQGQFTDAQGRPTRELYTYLADLQELIERYHAALTQIEPPLAMESKTVAALPSAAANTGKSYMVTDANATTFNSIVAGGGANIVRVFSNGTTWRIG